VSTGDEKTARFRKVEIRRPVSRAPAPVRPRGARVRYDDRRLAGVRRTFGRPVLVVKSWGSSLAPWRLVAVGVLIILVLVFSWLRLFHVGPPSVEDLRRAAGVDEWRTLPIGVKDDQPGIATYDTKNGWKGFDIDIAYMIAEDLGFRRDEVQFFRIESEDRARMEATDDRNPVEVKMVIASYSITAEREAEPNVMFSDSYLHTEQSVITLKGHAKVVSLEEFRNKDVCTLSASTSESAAEKAGAQIVRRNRIKECFDLLDENKVDAVTTDAAILGGYMRKSAGKYNHWDLGLDTTEAWGVSVGANEALRDLVNLTLYRSYQDPKDSRWEQAYADNILPEVGDNPGVPLARATQPEADRPRIRELPWEEIAP
jgi:glutamate transport system substrate-binding protein